MKLFILPLFLLLSSCQTVPTLSVQQKRLLQQKTFKAPYKDIFYSFRRVLQDNGYIIKNQDFKGGLITASKSRTNKFSGGEFAAILGFAVLGYQGQYLRKELDRFDISVSFDKIVRNTIETKLTIQHNTKDNFGGEGGSEVLDPKIYRYIYSQVSAELNRRRMKKKMAQ